MTEQIDITKLVPREDPKPKHKVYNPFPVDTTEFSKKPFAITTPI